MIESQIKITTRYAETDQMGIIHHSNYLIYMEQARLSWLDNLGFSYAHMEEEGVLLPVYQIDIKYSKPIRFNDEIKVIVRLSKIPTTRVIFDYEIRNSKDELCSTAHLVLVFTDSKTFRPIKPMPEFLEKCQKMFNG
jgi:acyl-CoA thioester hydrolase